MKVFITGGNGFIGTALTDHFLTQGADVTIFDRAEPAPVLARRFASAPGRFTALVGDIRDVQALEQALGNGNFDFLVHGAVITAAGERERREARTILDVNLMGTMSLIEALQKHAVKRALYVSSASVYGEAAFDPGPLDEEKNRPVPDSLYAISKYASERAWLRCGSLVKADLRAVRLGSAYGPFERRTGLRDTMSPPFQVMEARLSGRPATMTRDAMRDWIYTRDIVQAIEAVLMADGLTSPVFNLGLGENLPVSGFCAGLQAAVPEFVWKTDASADEATVDMHGSRDRSMLSIERLTGETGFKPAWLPERAAQDYDAWCQADPDLQTLMFT